MYLSKENEFLGEDRCSWEWVNESTARISLKFVKYLETTGVINLPWYISNTKLQLCWRRGYGMP